MSPVDSFKRMRKLFLLFPLAALLHATPLQASAFIKPDYKGDQVWTGKAKVSFWDDGKQAVVIHYPTFKGCSKVKDFMTSAKAGKPGAGIFGRHETMSQAEVNKLIRELSNSRPLGMYDTKYSSVQLRLKPYPKRPYC